MVVPVGARQRRRPGERVHPVDRDEPDAGPETARARRRPGVRDEDIVVNRILRPDVVAEIGVALEEAGIESSTRGIELIHAVEGVGVPIVELVDRRGERVPEGPRGAHRAHRLDRLDGARQVVCARVFAAEEQVQLRFEDVDDVAPHRLGGQRRDGEAAERAAAVGADLFVAADRITEAFAVLLGNERAGGHDLEGVDVDAGAADARVVGQLEVRRRVLGAVDRKLVGRVFDPSVAGRPPGGRQGRRDHIEAGLRRVDGVEDGIHSAVAHPDRRHVRALLRRKLDDEPLRAFGAGRGGGRGGRSRSRRALRRSRTPASCRRGRCRPGSSASARSRSRGTPPRRDRR